MSLSDKHITWINSMLGDAWKTNRHTIMHDKKKLAFQIGVKMNKHFVLAKKMQRMNKLKVVSHPINHGQPKVGQVENHVVDTSS